MRMLGRPYRNQFCRFGCCPRNSLRTATAQHSTKRLRAREKRSWRAEIW